MDKNKLFKKSINEQKQSLVKAIEKAKESRDNAPSAMESASDTRRSQAEKLVAALEDQLRETNKYADDVAPVQLQYLEVNINSTMKKFLTVPKGLGGIEVDGIRLLSLDTPLGQVLRDKKVGDKFEFNSQAFEVMKKE